MVVKPKCPEGLPSPLVLMQQRRMFAPLPQHQKARCGNDHRRNLPKQEIFQTPRRTSSRVPLSAYKMPRRRPPPHIGRANQPPTHPPSPQAFPCARGVGSGRVQCLGMVQLDGAIPETRGCCCLAFSRNWTGPSLHAPRNQSRSRSSAASSSGQDGMPDSPDPSVSVVGSLSSLLDAGRRPP